MIREDGLFKVLSLRLVVGLLGEKQNFNWWPTSFFGTSSQSFLEPAFPRTTALAQYHGVVEAARRIHDESLNVGSYHLFRLREETEQDLHGLIADGFVEGSEHGFPGDKQEAMQFLHVNASGKDGSPMGPTMIGRIAKLTEQSTITSMTDVYKSAFLRNERAFPYLVSA